MLGGISWSAKIRPWARLAFLHRSVGARRRRDSESGLFRCWGTGLVLAVSLCGTITACTGLPAKPESARGPLRVHPTNPRYFADDQGRAVYLTGAHTWLNLQDVSAGPEMPRFDFLRYLDFLGRHHLNFIRLWRQEEALFEPLPYLRTGPGVALDGKPKFDLNQPNPEFYDRLVQRVEAAERRGIYVAVMLFQGWGIERKDPERPNDPWLVHPFHKANNVNGIDGDRNGDGAGTETHSLLDPAVIARQVEFVQRVIDAVNRFDNVLYEIANESTPDSMPWQEYLVRLIHEYEATKPKQHPVLLTAPWGNKEADLWASQAEAVSPALPDPHLQAYPYRDDPPANDGRKVIVNDTDHLWGVGGTRAWVWKSFLRGLHPIYMDPYDPAAHPEFFDTVRETRDAVLEAMGQTRRLSGRLPLESMTPRYELCSTRYCLVAPGRAYVVYVPSSASDPSPQTVEVDLQASSGPFEVVWFSLDAGTGITERRVLPSGRVTLTAPFTGEAVLALRAMCQ